MTKIHISVNESGEDTSQNRTHSVSFEGDFDLIREEIDKVYKEFRYMARQT